MIILLLSFLFTNACHGSENKKEIKPKSQYDTKPTVPSTLQNKHLHIPNLTYRLFIPKKKPTCLRIELLRSIYEKNKQTANQIAQYHNTEGYHLIKFNPTENAITNSANLFLTHQENPSLKRKAEEEEEEYFGYSKSFNPPHPLEFHPLPYSPDDNKTQPSLTFPWTGDFGTEDQLDPCPWFKENNEN